MMLSIVIPIIPDETSELVRRTIEGIERTVGLPANEYTITFVGIAPYGLYTWHAHQDWNLVSSTEPVGTKRNKGAEYVIRHYDPDVITFMDAHMNFFDVESKGWGKVLHKFLVNKPNAIVGPAISMYDNPQQRGFGVLPEVKEEKETMDISWTWWGSGALNGTPFEVPGLCACMMAMKPQTFKDSVVGFIPYFRIEDRELSMRMWLLGKTLYSIPELTVGHRFVSSPPPMTRQQSIDWGAGYLLHAFLNIGEPAAVRLYEKGIRPSEDRAESLKLATSAYWRQVRQELLSKRVRTPEQYFRRFAYT